VRGRIDGNDTGAVLRRVKVVAESPDPEGGPGSLKPRNPVAAGSWCPGVLV